MSMSTTMPSLWASSMRAFRSSGVPNLGGHAQNGHKVSARSAHNNGEVSACPSSMAFASSGVPYQGGNAQKG
eukprot:scaffold47790_cov16-Tisochrysis_lutea.AAC.3